MFAFAIHTLVNFLLQAQIVTVVLLSDIIFRSPGFEKSKGVIVDFIELVFYVKRIFSWKYVRFYIAVILPLIEDR